MEPLDRDLKKRMHCDMHVRWMKDNGPADTATAKCSGADR